MNQLDFLFFSKRSQGQYIPPHTHDCYELVYYYANGKTTVDSIEYIFSKDQFALISPDVEHDEIHHTDADVLFIGFHCDYPGIANLNGIFDDNTDRTIQHIVHRMKDEFMQRQDHFAEMLNLLVGELAIHLQRLIGTKKAPYQTEDRMQYVRNYMDEYFRQKLSIETLADIAGYSYDRFRHLFKEKYGIAPLQYLYQKRLNYAKDCLLNEPLMLVSDIALESGFVNDSQFSSMFKREIGMTPRMFRALHAENAKNN
ncbi:AraC family transcriptional regulator [Paenibacillus faecalis]|uniref:AraC family transcriptional regulator n=1 Tax=Paenibacillus faecalis TaxID=2079532 RepID=UPI000D1048E3|nr:helix-turn-helix domain-containing protein [Paenibacillus faecalis]